MAQVWPSKAVCCCGCIHIKAAVLPDNGLTTRGLIYPACTEVRGLRSWEANNLAAC